MQRCPKPWIVMLLTLVLGTCSKSGEAPETVQPGGSLDSNEQETPTPVSRSTHIGMHLLYEEKFEYQGCESRQIIDQLPKLADDFRLDGSVLEWNVDTLVAKSIDAGDHVGLELHLARSTGGELIGAMHFSQPLESGEIQLEFFGQFVNAENQLKRQTPIRLKLRDDQIYAFVQEEWHTLYPKDGVELRKNARGMEFRFQPYSLLGSTISMPLWSVQAFAYTDGQELHAFLPRAFLPSIQSTRQSNFEIAKCLIQTEKGDMRLTEISQSFGSNQEHFSISRALTKSLSQYLDIQVWGAESFVSLARDVEDLWAESDDLRDPVYKLHLPILVDTRKFAKSENGGNQRSIFASQWIRGIVGKYLLRQRPSVEAFVLEVFQEAIAHHLDRRLLASWFHVEQGVSAGQSFQSGLSKSFALGLLLSYQAELEVFLQLWQDENIPSHLLFETLGSQLNLGDSAWDGWLNRESFQGALHPDVLRDSENDGLIDLFEVTRDLDPLSLDTDGDGWTDFSEVVLETDANNVSKHPSWIVRDGSFGDWEELLPSRLLEDSDTLPGGCPAASDIQLSGALIRDLQLIVAMRLAGKPKAHERLVWYVDVDVPPLNRKFLIKAIQGEKTFQILDSSSSGVLKTERNPLVNGSGVVEVSIDFDQLDLGDIDLKNIDFTAEGAIAIRAFSELAGSPARFCDDTVWFSPVVSVRQ